MSQECNVGNVIVSTKGIELASLGLETSRGSNSWVSKLTTRPSPACLARRKLVNYLPERTNPYSWDLACGIVGKTANKYEDEPAGESGTTSWCMTSDPANLDWFFLESRTFVHNLKLTMYLE